MNRQKHGENRGIEWTDFAHNPVRGCKHDCEWIMPDGQLAVCYASEVATGVARMAYPQGFQHHYWSPEHLGDPLKLKTPAKIFLDSMSDLFGHWVPDSEIQTVLDMCARAHWHTFQVLTKNAPRVEKFNFPPNVWVGASVPPSHFMGKTLDQHQQSQMLLRALDALQRVNAPVRWISFEPLSWDVAELIEDSNLQWAVIGAASRGNQVYQPDPKWVYNLLQALDDMGTPVFFKGNLAGNTAADPWREEFPGEIATNAYILSQQSLF